jgi:hypothetical protein
MTTAYVERPTRVPTVTERLSELLAERAGPMPVWVRPPKEGTERYSGLTRPKLYELANSGRIRTASLREPGRTTGVRLFHLGSILDYIARCELVPAAEPQKASNGSE